MITVIGNLKGGSGKSTVAFNLAVWLAKHGKRVTTFDLDPQRTLTDVADVRAEEGYTPLFSLHYGGDELLDEIREKSGEVIIDVGTANMGAFKAVIAVADRIVIPVPPSQADVWSTQRFLTLVDKVEVEGKRPEIIVFVNRADTHQAIRESDEAEAALAELEGIRLIPSRLCQRTAYRRSFSEGLGVFERQPSSKASKEFASFAKKLYPRIG